MERIALLDSVSSHVHWRIKRRDILFLLATLLWYVDNGKDCFMNEQAQVKALAELAGWEDFVYSLNNSQGLGGTPPNWGDSDMRYHSCEEYLTSYDAIIPLIQKQTQNISNRIYLSILERQEYGMHIFSATPAQLCEALLRSTGKWTE